MDVRHLELSVRAQNCLKKARIVTLEQLNARPDVELLAVEGLGKNTLAKIRKEAGQLNGPKWHLELEESSLLLLREKMRPLLRREAELLVEIEAFRSLIGR
jgi:DNA-directed RNA polymerase alpha subunit